MCRLRNIALESVTEKCGRQTDRQTDNGQSDPYVSLCFAGDTKSKFLSTLDSDIDDKQQPQGYDNSFPNIYVLVN